MRNFIRFGEFCFENELGLISFATFEKATRFANSLASGYKSRFDYAGFEIDLAGQNLEFNGFDLKVYNNGVYDREIRQNGVVSNLNRYDLFAKVDSIRKIIYNGEDDFEEIYEKALRINDEIGKFTGRYVDVIVYNGVPFTLHYKYLDHNNRGYKTIEDKVLDAKRRMGMKKGTCQGFEKAKKLQMAILAKSGN